jgi:hypothetical protein
MGVCLKALFLSSHVGLGHVARDYAIANALRRVLPSISIEWCSAEPAISFLDRLGERVVDECKVLESFSSVIEDLYNGRINGLRDLASRLNILRRNYAIIDDLLSRNQYDLVFADEFWEIVYSAPQSVKDRVVFATDLIYKPYSIKPLDFILSLILNKYFKNTLWRFKLSMFFNDIEILDDYKWYWFFGGGVRDWVLKHMVPIGLVTSYLYEELPDRTHARRFLGLGGDEALIVVGIGGTSTRSIYFLDCLDRIIPVIYSELKKLFGVNEVVVKAITGPRTNWVSNSGLIEVVRGVQPRLLNYYVASDMFIMRAGRTSTADIYCLGKPAVFIPIMDHFEQEEIAKYMWKRHGYPFLRENECTSQKLLWVLRRAYNNIYSPNKDLCMGVDKASEILASVINTNS